MGIRHEQRATNFTDHSYGYDEYEQRNNVPKPKRQ